MFFIVSKIFWLIAEPVALLLGVGVVGVLLGFTRFARVGRAVVAFSIITLAIALLTPLGALLLRPLEERFPQPSVSAAEPTGIIVLGGALDEARSEARGEDILTGDGARLTTGLKLALRYPNARLVFTGGAANLSGEEPAEAIGVRKLWLALGAPEGRVSFEARSRNTWENALFTLDLLQPGPNDKWLLVTSAWHMPRAVGIFRRVGFNVTPYSVAYRTFGDRRDWFVSAMPEKVAMLDFAVREYVGLLAYRLTGKTSELFPAP
ncbi:YdcF family protein [Methylocapsa palsarum]|uniref:Uncharacterized SAM-binding protein YcdF, DUF218 family n=1 Tax=Methylocapsa palsarum TaxID=1612308 RepID=A0A1I3WPC5_9HYPH|nr:YdcF family protein [Methylocapsa palsarum]SFK09220.1 Uncharacterized SAM-binding protein YcdF, DUF218 family [Methylocapsa palsarum]